MVQLLLWPYFFAHTCKVVSETILIYTIDRAYHIT